MDIRIRILRVPGGRKKAKFAEGATLRAVLNNMPGPFNDYQNCNLEAHRGEDVVRIADPADFRPQDGDLIVVSANVKGNDESAKLIDAFSKMADAMVPMDSRDLFWLLENYDLDKPKIIRELVDRCSLPFIVFDDEAKLRVNVEVTTKLFKEIKKGAVPVNPNNPYIQLGGKWFRVYSAGEAMKQYGEICPITGVFLVEGFSSGINRNWTGVSVNVRELVFVYRIHKYGDRIPSGTELELLIQKVFNNTADATVANALPEGAIELERLTKAGVNVSQLLVRAYPEGESKLDRLVTAPATRTALKSKGQVQSTDEYGDSDDDEVEVEVE